MRVRWAIHWMRWVWGGVYNTGCLGFHRRGQRLGPRLSRSGYDSRRVVFVPTSKRVQSSKNVNQLMNVVTWAVSLCQILRLLRTYCSPFISSSSSCPRDHAERNRIHANSWSKCLKEQVWQPGESLMWMFKVITRNTRMFCI